MKMESLFDIFCEDNTQRRHLENVYRLRMREKDYAFYTGQKTTRAAKITAVIQKLKTDDIRFKRRAESLESPSTSRRLELETVSNDSIKHLAYTGSVVILHNLHQMSYCISWVTVIQSCNKLGSI